MVSGLFAWGGTLDVKWIPLVWRETGRFCGCLRFGRHGCYIDMGMKLSMGRKMSGVDHGVLEGVFAADRGCDLGDFRFCAHAKNFSGSFASSSLTSSILACKAPSLQNHLTERNCPSDPP